MHWQRCTSFIAMKAIANLSWVVREHRTGCRLPPALLQVQQNQSPNAVRSRNPSKSMLAHDAVAAAVSHKHHSIIRVGAGLIHFVCGSHLRFATELIYQRILFSTWFSRAVALFARNIIFFICSKYYDPAWETDCKRWNMGSEQVLTRRNLRQPKAGGRSCTCTYACTNKRMYTHIYTRTFTHAHSHKHPHLHSHKHPYLHWDIKHIYAHIHSVWQRYSWQPKWSGEKCVRTFTVKEKKNGILNTLYSWLARDLQDPFSDSLGWMPNQIRSGVQ